MTNPSFAFPPALHRAYLTQLDKRRQVLTSFLAKHDARSLTELDLKEALLQAHNVTGSGATYGFPALSEAGRILEYALQNKVEAPVVAELVRRLLRVCVDILRNAEAAPEAIPEASLASVPERVVEQGANEPVALAPKPILTLPLVTKPLMLIADDDLDVSTMLQHLFSQDAQIVTALDGAKALEIITHDKPALVILDDKMPALSGMQLVEQLQEAGMIPMPQIIMLTASDSVPDIIRGMSAGVIDYVTKPFDPQKLAVRVRSLLRSLNKTVLIADDDAAVRGILFHKFRLLGLRVIQAESGAKALELAEEFLPDLAILDRMMPDIDGLVVLQTLRQKSKFADMPVIMLTAKRQNKDIVEGFEMGATDYVVKPFLLDEVVARVLARLELTLEGSS